MKKLHLNLDDLQVESFRTADESAGRGTVRGHEPMGADLSEFYGDPCSGDSICVCNTTFTARLPECGGDTEICP